MKCFAADAVKAPLEGRRRARRILRLDLRALATKESLVNSEIPSRSASAEGLQDSTCQAMCEGRFNSAAKALATSSHRAILCGQPMPIEVGTSACTCSPGFCNADLRLGLP